MTKPLSDEKILQSWHTNAAPWAIAVRAQQIESRRLVTDNAIIDAVLATRPHSILDIGCGEGWLCRALASHGLRTTGIDAIPALIEAAKTAPQDNGQNDNDNLFDVLAYEQLATYQPGRVFDVAVCNFSLIGKDSVDTVFRTVAQHLTAKGYLIVQTLHPCTANQPLYQDGWRSGSWAGFSDQFSDPAPWYFRTLSSWLDLFIQSSFTLCNIHEPIHPNTGQPSSIIFTAQRQ